VGTWAARAATGEPLVVATIQNSGRRTLDISGTLTLSKGRDWKVIRIT
jgi:hypothetical protein